MNELLIALITSVDIFAAVMGLCCSGIRLPRVSACAVSLVGAGALCAAAALSELAAEFFGGFTGAAYISKGILLIIGVKALLDGIREMGGFPKKSLNGEDISRGEIPREEISRKKTPREKKLPRGSIFDIAGAPEKADCDSSSEISLPEAVLLGTALSADSVFTGISAGIGGLSPLLILALSFISGLCACGLGIFAGRLLCRGCRGKFPAGIITGAGLIVIAALF